MPLPASGGFYRSGAQPATFELIQHDCRQLDLHVALRDGGNGNIAWLIELLLTPEGRKRQIHWSEHSLLYKRKFTPAGFRLPGQRQWMELELTKLEDGSLHYHLIHRERENSRPLNQIDCVLEPAGR